MSREMRPMERISQYAVGWLWIALFGSFPLVKVVAIDFASVQQEPNLERRSQMAIDYANSALEAARTAYQASDLEKTEADLKRVGEAVDLAYGSLQQTGKQARRDPKFFKRTELATRQILRRIDGFAESMSLQDRALTEKLRDRVASIHDDLLQGIMGKKRQP